MNLSPAEPSDPDTLPTIAGATRPPESASGATPSALPAGGAPAPRKAIGPYEILSELGRGGMGVVYKAFHPGLKRTVALKVMIAGEDASEAAIARFRREAESVAKLGHHPNIVPVYDLGQVVRDPGAGAQHAAPLHYIAMHYVDGKSLDRVITDEEIGPRRAAVIAKKLAEALAHAHGHGILHRDIKPQNVLLTKEGEPQITDFGLAKDVLSGSKVTASGTTLGSPNYMSPEQADGRIEAIDVRSDVWSLGATLYEMLTFQPPFDGTTVVNVIQKVILQDPAPPRRLNPLVDRDLETICLKCLEKEPNRRYPDANTLAADLGRYLSGDPILARPRSFLSLAANRIRRRKALTTAVLACAAALAVSAAFAVWYAREKAKEKGAWTLVFEDRFDRQEVGTGWVPVNGEWTIHDGALCCTRQASSSIRIARDFQGDVRIEYEAEPAEWPVCSMASLLCAQEPDLTGTGYFLGFGDNLNTRSYVRRRGVPVAVNPDARIEKGRRYRIAAERRGFRVSMTVDGREINAAEDFFPLRGEGRDGVGLYSWRSHVHFDNVRVYVRGAAEKFTRLTAADMLFEEGAFARAADVYRTALGELEGREAEITRLKEGLALGWAGRVAEGEQALSGLSAEASDGAVRVHALAALARLAALGKDPEKAWTWIERGLRDLPERDRTALFLLAPEFILEMESRGEAREAFETGMRLFAVLPPELLMPRFPLLERVLRGLARQGRTPEAVALVDRLLAGVSNPLRRAELDYQAAVFLPTADPGRLSRAFQAWQEALGREGWGFMAEAAGRYAIAEAMARSGRPDAAEKHFPDLAPCIRWAAGDARSALASAEDAASRAAALPADSPERASTAATAGWILLLAGEAEAAKELVSREKEDFSPWLQLVLDLAQGRRESARERATRVAKACRETGSLHAVHYAFLAGEAGEEDLRNAWTWGSPAPSDTLGFLECWIAMRRAIDGDREGARVLCRHSLAAAPKGSLLSGIARRLSASLE